MTDLSDGQTPDEKTAGSKRTLWSRRYVRASVATAAVLGVGGGAYGIASAVTSNSSPSAAPSSSSPVPNGSSLGRGPFGASNRAGTSGTVVSIGTDSFDIRTSGGASITVDVSSSTLYSQGRGAASSFSDLKTGQSVIIVGAKSGLVIHATRVLAPSFSGGSFGTGSRTIGSVTSVGSNSFIVTTRAGSTVTVDVSSSTIFRAQGAANASFSDVKNGETVLVGGSGTSSAFHASTVLIVPSGGFGGFGGSRGGGFGTGFGSTT